MKYVNIVLLVLFIVIIGCTQLKQANESFNTGNYRNVIKLTTAALQKDSTNTDAMKLLADSYFALNKYDSSFIYYTTILAYKKDDPFSKEKISRIFCIKGDKLVIEKEYYKAIEQYERSLSYVTEQTLVIKKIGDSYYSAGRHDKARTWYEKIINTMDSTEIYQKLESLEQSQDTAEKHLETGLKYKEKNNYSRAKKEFEKALEIKPDYKEAKYQKYMVTGLPLYRKGKMNGLWDAIEAFGLASALFPERAEPHYYMGLSYNKKDRDEYDNAISEFELVIKYDPDSKMAKQAKSKIVEWKKRRKKMNDFLNN